MRTVYPRYADEEAVSSCSPVHKMTKSLNLSKIVSHSLMDDGSSMHPGHFKRKKAPTPVWLDDPADISLVRDTDIPLHSRLTTEIKAFVSYMNGEIEIAQESVQDSIARLNTCIEKQWPTARATCFGSFASGLWLPTSDVDVVIQGIPAVDKLGAPLDTILDIVKAESWVEHASIVGTKVTVIKVILKACHRRMDIAVETADTQHGLAATEILRTAVLSMPAMRPLAIVLKTFLREKGLNSAFTGGLSSYALVLLCLHYMLQPGHASENDDGVGKLLLGFLEYYGTLYDHKRTGITWLVNPLGHLESVEYELKSGGKCRLVLDDPINPDERGVYNVGAGAYAMARVVSALENAFYAIKFHRASRFTPTPLSQMIHWSGPSTV
ncbi:unnamed protein product [Aphanomyces euteiches]|uniref:Poly(A) RNA polymerase mitochondrial-like central palm domain-containing protein n=1 Tax=Aphanomyces euteiches TaxID=100861 RepID=A0A6G0XB96_9STRA|nr:hypothetical protein Ae201684_006466 [Aphanomyces euteiches]KAH9091162.1 hypothetical protein Ae201684P_006562 [Aphanomyces euteiches]KAH9145329.1 hypothetical protein AeRB84_010777 [Aphanomyces euteiches]